MKRSKTIHQTAKNASKLHKYIGELLVELFPNYEVRQEYAVNKVNSNFDSGREKFDWVVLGLNIVCEIHGEQHYTPVCFGGMLMSEAKRIFEQRVRVDKEKQDAAESAGWAYLVVKYTEKKITSDELADRISTAISESTGSQAKSDMESRSSRRHDSNARKQTIQSRGFQKKPEGYKHKWPTRKFSRK